MTVHAKISFILRTVDYADRRYIVAAQDGGGWGVYDRFTDECLNHYDLDRLTPLELIQPVGSA